MSMVVSKKSLKEPLLPRNLCWYTTISDSLKVKFDPSKKYPGGTFSPYAYGMVSPNSFQATQKCHFNSSFIASHPKISAHFILRILYVNMKYPETIQIEVRITSCEPRNISSTIFHVKRYDELNIISVLFGPKSVTFGNIRTKNIGLTPGICMC